MEIYYGDRVLGSFSKEKEVLFLTLCKSKKIPYLPLERNMEENSYVIFPPLRGTTVALCSLQNGQCKGKNAVTVLKTLEHRLIQQGALVLNVADKRSLHRMMEVMNVQVLLSTKESTKEGKSRDSDSRIRFFYSLKRSKESLEIIAAIIKSLVKNNPTNYYEIPGLLNYLLYWKGYSFFFSPVPTVLVEICNTKQEEVQLQEAIYQALIECARVKHEDKQDELIAEIIEFLARKDISQLTGEEKIKKESRTENEERIFTPLAAPDRCNKTIAEELNGRDEIDIERFEYFSGIEGLGEAEELEVTEEILGSEDKKNPGDLDDYLNKLGKREKPEESKIKKEKIEQLEHGEVKKPKEVKQHGKPQGFEGTITKENKKSGINSRKKEAPFEKVVAEQIVNKINIFSTATKKLRKRRGGVASLYPPPDGHVFQFSAPIKEGDGYPFLPPHVEGDNFFPFKSCYYAGKENVMSNNCGKGHQQCFGVQNSPSNQGRSIPLQKLTVNLLDEIKKLDVMDKGEEENMQLAEER